MARLAQRTPECRRILRLLAPAGEPLGIDELAAASAAFETHRRPPGASARAGAPRGVAASSRPTCWSAWSRRSSTGSR